MKLALLHKSNFRKKSFILLALLGGASLPIFAQISSGLFEFGEKAKDEVVSKNTSVPKSSSASSYLIPFIETIRPQVELSWNFRHPSVPEVESRNQKIPDQKFSEDHTHANWEDRPSPFQMVSNPGNVANSFDEGNPGFSGVRDKLANMVLFRGPELGSNNSSSGVLPSQEIPPGDSSKFIPPSPIPEPNTWVMLLLGLCTICVLRILKNPK